jgi:hypothetical protein
MSLFQKLKFWESLDYLKAQEFGDIEFFHDIVDTMGGDFTYAVYVMPIAKLPWMAEYTRMYGRGPRMFIGGFPAFRNLNTIR